MPRRNAIAALFASIALSAMGPPAAADVSPPPPASALAADGFELISDSKGIKVYQRDKRGGVELGVEGNIAATPDRVRQVILDYPRYSRWQKHIKETRVLARAEGSLDVYERLDLPVIDDRDFTLHVTWGDGAVPWVRFTTSNALGPPPVKGVVRVRQHEGGWRLEPVDGGKATHLVYRFYLDLMSSLPTDLCKRRAASELTELIAGIAKQLPAAVDG
jgi:hypothetical protein